MAEKARAAEEWRRAIANLNTWKRDERRAVHKPLLLLWLIARAARGGSARVEFSEVAGPLARLLREFGPPRKSVHPEYPFWHLQSDGVWEVERAETLPLRKAGNSPSKRTLVQSGAWGFVPPPLWNALVRKPSLRRELSETLLQEYWPPSYEEDLRDELGLDAAAVGRRRLVSRAVRDPAFRDAVLAAYGGRCALCGYDGRLGADNLALEAAHVKWHCYGGPDSLDNGLALCSFHHATFDRGAWGVLRDLRVRISPAVSGGEMVDSLLRRFSGGRLLLPGPAALAPAHVDWHGREVFRGN